MRIAGSVALITGAGRGLGKAFSRVILERGGKVSVVEINEKVGSEFVDECKTEFGADSAHFISCDVTDKARFKDAFEESISKFGKIDILCNNAGILEAPDWRKTIDVNVTSVIEGTFLGIKHMGLKSGGNGGVIINIASMAGISPFDGSPVYTASKHAVVGFSRSLRRPLKDQGIRVNCLCPAFTPTAMVAEGLKLNPGYQSIVDKMGLNKIEDVVKGFIQLIEDDSQDGAALTVTARDGIKYAFVQKDKAATKPSSKL